MAAGLHLPGGRASLLSSARSRAWRRSGARESVRESLNVIDLVVPAGSAEFAKPPRRRGVLGGGREAPDPFIW
jgi:hypothetical protein